MAITESYLENNFVTWCKDRDIVAIKGPTATSKGFPDRFLQLPNYGGTIYVEFKGSSYYTLTPIQLWWRDYIIASSPNRYFLIDDMEGLNTLKMRCLEFIALGKQVTDFETGLLVDYELEHEQELLINIKKDFAHGE